jgi:hypothetical protein
METIVDEWFSILMNFNIDVRIDENENPNDESAPLARLCWHCCHEIPSKVLQYPVAYDDRRQTFKVCGQFCSWECIKGYSRDKMSNAMSGIHQMNIRHYRKKITGLIDTVVAAPPFMSLKAFGGHLTIEEFRKPQKNIEYDVHYAKLTKLIPYQTFEYKYQHVRKQDQENKQVAFGATTQENDCLKLRRPKPLTKEKGTLERTLGLNGFGNMIKMR